MFLWNILSYYLIVRFYKTFTFYVLDKTQYLQLKGAFEHIINFLYKN